MRAIVSIAAVLGCLAIVASGAWAQAAPELPALAAQPTTARPRVALVLSGGGARGFAHIGVLRVLRDMRIPVDIVVGTSMGSVIGGAFAAGVSVDALEQMVRNTDWNSVIADRPARDDLTFRRREEDTLLPSRIEFAVSRQGVSLPPSAAGNAALELALTRLLPKGTRERPVSTLPLPFRSVASDLVTGELVELADTPLFMAMRASLAVPGVFAPVRINQRLLVDGGLVRNLPVDMARRMGAQVIIAVNVGTPLAPESELGSAVGVANQMLQILTEQNVQRSLRELQAQDILIAPNLDGVSFLDFQRHARAIQAGELAARALALRLAPLALDGAAYAAAEDRRLAATVHSDPALPLARLEVQHQGKINPEVLATQLSLREGDLVTLEHVHQAARTLYGRGDVAHVDTEVYDEGGRRSVLIRSTEAGWASSRLRVGLELASDFSDRNVFDIKLMHVRSALNAWGAELRTIARIGNERGFGVQYWQPLGPGSPWYLAPSFQYGSGANDFYDGGRRTLRLAVKGRTATLALGRQFGNWGDVQLGVTRASSDVGVAIPETPAVPELRLLDTSMFLHWRTDTLDSLAFPSRGSLVDLNLQGSRSGGATRGSLAQTDMVAMGAFHTDNWAGHVYGEWARAQRGLAPLALGGFLRLSGTPSNSVNGKTVALARVVMARRVASLPGTLGGAVRLGFSAEVGATLDAGSAQPRTGVKQAGSAFVAVDTRFGPLYFGAGVTRFGAGTLYVFLGPIW